MVGFTTYQPDKLSVFRRREEIVGKYDTVQTTLDYRRSVAAYNKQGGRGYVSFPTDIENQALTSAEFFCTAILEQSDSDVRADTRPQ